MDNVIKVSNCIHIVQFVVLPRDYAMKATNIVREIQYMMMSGVGFLKYCKRTAGDDLMDFGNHLSHISDRRQTILIGAFSWVSLIPNVITIRFLMPVPHSSKSTLLMCVIVQPSCFVFGKHLHRIARPEFGCSGWYFHQFLVALPKVINIAAISKQVRTNSFPIILSTSFYRILIKDTKPKESTYSENISLQTIPLINSKAFYNISMMTVSCIILL
jgi:hypothetical protein